MIRAVWVIVSGLVAGLTGIVIGWGRNDRRVYMERSRLVNPHRRGRNAARKMGGR